MRPSEMAGEAIVSSSIWFSASLSNCCAGRDDRAEAVHVQKINSPLGGDRRGFVIALQPLGPDRCGPVWMSKHRAMPLSVIVKR